MRGVADEFSHLLTLLEGAQPPLRLRARCARIRAGRDGHLDREVARERLAVAGFVPHGVEAGALARAVLAAGCLDISISCCVSRNAAITLSFAICNSACYQASVRSPAERDLR